jgi:hypothetical protein
MQRPFPDLNGMPKMTGHSNGTKKGNQVIYSSKKVLML